LRVDVGQAEIELDLVWSPGSVQDLAAFSAPAEPALDPPADARAQMCGVRQAKISCDLLLSPCSGLSLAPGFQLVRLYV
jgi:hypothetical protein